MLRKLHGSPGGGRQIMSGGLRSGRKGRDLGTRRREPKTRVRNCDHPLAASFRIAPLLEPSVANGSYWRSWLRQSSSGRLDPYTRGTAAYVQLHSLSPSSA